MQNSNIEIIDLTTSDIYDEEPLYSDIYHDTHAAIHHYNHAAINLNDRAAIHHDHHAAIRHYAYGAMHHDDHAVIDLDDHIVIHHDDHAAIQHDVIDLDDSDDEDADEPAPEGNHEGDARDNEEITIKHNAEFHHICTICWEQLGGEPMVSTHCGHVFCQPCLEKCLEQNKRCPLCRSWLTGPKAYHRLFVTFTK